MHGTIGPAGIDGNSLGRVDLVSPQVGGVDERRSGGVELADEGVTGAGVAWLVGVHDREIIGRGGTAQRDRKGSGSNLDY